MTNLIWIALVIVIAFAVIANRPAVFRVERSVMIQAPPERITKMVENFHNWNQWTPWAHVDPTMSRNFSGPPFGAGAVYEWEGDQSVGKGRMEVLESHARRTTIRMNFQKPFRANHTSDFVLDPEGKGTRVTWVLHSRSSIGAKILNLMTRKDQEIGDYLMMGLQSLKAQIEGCLSAERKAS